MKVSSTDHWVKCISTHGNMRGVAVQATKLIETMATRQKLHGIAIQGLGEAVMGALLVASYCKTGQRINLNIRGTGFFQQALVDAYPEGTVRGYVIERERILTGEDKLGPWGSGLLSVLRTKSEGGRNPYIGTVPLLTGHLAKDLSYYWVQSEQVPSAVGLAVNLEDDQVKSASGFLVQALPGANSEEIKEVERHIQEIQSFSKGSTSFTTPTHLLSQIFQSSAFVIVEEKKIEFRCNCSRERVQRALSLVGIEELQSMLLEDEVPLVRCDFCEKEYKLDAFFLKKLIQNLKKIRR